MLMLAACGKTELSSDKSAYVDDCSAKQLITRTKLVPVIEQAVERRKLLAGKVTFDEGKVVRIFPMLGGVVTEVKVNLGEYVEKNQLLAIVRSPDIANLEDDYLDAQSDIIVAKRQLTAAKELSASGLASEKEIVFAQEEYNKAQARLDKMREVLNIFNSSGEASYKLLAPTSGYVVGKTVNSGMQIRNDNNEPAFIIGSIDQVWVLADVFEDDLISVEKGMEVSVSPLASQQKVYKATIAHVAETLDPQTRTVKARIVIPNQEHFLKPEMYVSIRLVRIEDKVLPAIPKQAIVFDENQHYVVAFQDSCKQWVEKVQVYAQNDSLVYLNKLPQEVKTVVGRGSLNVFNALVK